MCLFYPSKSKAILYNSKTIFCQKGLETSGFILFWIGTMKYVGEYPGTSDHQMGLMVDSVIFLCDLCVLVAKYLFFDPMSSRMIVIEEKRIND